MGNDLFPAFRSCQRRRVSARRSTSQALEGLARRHRIVRFGDGMIKQVRLDRAWQFSI